MSLASTATRLSLAAGLLTSLPCRAEGWGLVKVRALGWLWPLLAAVLVAALALWHVLRAQRLRTIFVSYRRSDSASQTMQVVAGLLQHFGRRGVFHDVVSITPGADFRSAIVHTLHRCDAALVIIGPDWATCTGADGQPRLQVEGDVVRSEVATALTSGALVVPVLVGGAHLPEPQQLPPELHGLLHRNAVHLDPADANASQVLTVAIRAAPMRRTPGYLALCHASVLVQLAVFFQAGGLLDSEFTTALGIATPALAAVLAVMLAQRLGPSQAPARVPRVAPATLALPLLFVAAISALVVSRALNLMSFDAFRVGLSFVSIGFAAYTGIVLATVRENRSAA